MSKAFGMHVLFYTTTVDLAMIVLLYYSSAIDHLIVEKFLLRYDVSMGTSRMEKNTHGTNRLGIVLNVLN